MFQAAFWSASGGVIKDPYMGKNDFAAKAQTEKTWYLKKTFSYSGSKRMWNCIFMGLQTDVTYI